ncbi:MAG: YkgJ family cysteine cluster protein [Phycisphaerales bacterium]
MQGTTDGGGEALGPRGDRPWYADGLRFECTQCGNCCSGPPGAVWFDLDEAEAMARAVGVSLELFLERYTRRIGARRSLKELSGPRGFDCVFLDRDSKPGTARCSIYKARPRQCRTWPWWPEVVETPESWAETKRRTPCPGMDSGPVHPLVEITIGLTGG